MKRRLLLFVLGIIWLWHHTALAQDRTWFSEATQELQLLDSTASRMNVADINGDEYPDLIVVDGIYGRNQIKVYLNQADPNNVESRDRVFVDFTKESGVNAHPDGITQGRRADIVCLADIDNDGDNDMVTGIFHFRPNNINEDLVDDRCEVLLNDGKGHFSILPKSALHELGFVSVTGFSFLDYDLDGVLDLYVATFSQDHSRNQFRQDHLLKGIGNGNFTDVSQQAGLANIAFPMYGCSAFDWNNDRYPDVFTAPYCRSNGSALRNNGDGTFTDVAADIGYNARYSTGDVDGNGPRIMCQWGAYPSDYDNDGDLDILQVLVHGGIDPGEGRTVLNINNGEFQNFTLTRDLSLLQRQNPQSFHLGNFDASWVDIDNDGKQDVIITEAAYLPQTDRIFIHRQDDDRNLVDITPELELLTVKSPAAVEVFDYDLDGDDDLITQLTQDQNRIIVLRNEIGSQNNWIGIKLVPPPGVNRNAIGAKVKVFTSRTVQMREVMAGTGHFAGQQPLTLNFGLGREEMVRAVQVIWPSTQVANTTINNPPINRIISTGDAQATDVVAYPNPAGGHTFLSGESLFDAGLEGLYLFDASGQRLFVPVSQINPSNVRLDLNGLRPGAYLAKVIKSDGSVTSTHFVKTQ